MPTLEAVPDYIHESVRALPVLPTAVARLLTLTKEVDVDFGEVARVIETDQTLTARTLRAANSPLYSVSRQIKTVRQATVLLGSETIVNLALGVSVMSFQSGLHKHLPISAKEFGRHSIAVALVARRLAQHFHLSHGEAFVAGLLHDIGKLVLLMHHKEDYARVIRKAQEGDRALHVLEAEAFDLDHALVGHALCAHWNLPPSLAQAVAEHHAEPAPRTVADVVSRANDLVKIQQIGDSGNRFVVPYGLSSQPRDPIAKDWLREMVLALPLETRQAEEAMGQAPDGEPEAESDEAERPAVHLQVVVPDERELLLSMLLSMGYDPVETREASLGANGHARGPIALITEAPATDLYRIAYQQRNMPIVDYAAWRAENRTAEGGGFDAYRLRSWLQEQIAGQAETA